ncbi:MAG: PLP-dependent aminotransferase family protein [Marinibacterium sp.]|nr:PLP-dependent aminotransferase family protein [Marinibacterium sp.]
MGTIWAQTLSGDKGPKYKRVADTIRGAVDRGQLTPGAKLPPVRELAYQLGITPGTVARAYTILTDEGLLQAEVGRGTFVAEPQSEPQTVAPIEIDAIAHNARSDGYSVNMFSPHMPNVGQARLIRKLLAEIAETPPSGVMHYPSRAGSRPARQAAVSWLSGTAAGRLSEQDLILTNGGQNGISLVMQAVLRGRRPVVLVEDLSYPGHRRAAELLRADVVPVAMDDQGLIPEALEAAARGQDAQLLCTSPEVHNPTGIFTPLARREALLRVVRRLNLQILEDECYRVGSPRAPGYRMLAPERSWYVSSISKTLTPALRLGVVAAPEGQIANVRRAMEHGYFGLATPMSDLAAALLAHPDIHAYEAAVRDRLSEYIRVAVNVLGRYDVVWRQDVPFLWLNLPAGWRAGAFCQAAEAQGVQIRSAEEYACRHSRVPHSVRMSVNAGVPLDMYEAAMLRLRQLLDNPPEQISV